MTSGWRAYKNRTVDTLRALRERGQSETLGVALLTGVVLILVAVVGLFLFADFGANDEEQLLANIQGDIEATSVTLTHEGGNAFDPGTVEVVLTGDTEHDWILNKSFSAIEGGGGEFAPGDIWESDNSGLIIGDGRLLVIHETSGTILLDQPYSIEQDGVSLAVETYQGTPKTGQATIHENANWSYELGATLGGQSYDQTDNLTYNISFSGPGAEHLNWADDGNHEIQVYNNVSSQTSATAEAEIIQNGSPLNETGTVDLTLKPEPNVVVNITDANVVGGGSLSVNSGQFGTQGLLGEDEVLQGDDISVTANITNTQAESVTATQDIGMDMAGMDQAFKNIELGPKQSKDMSFVASIPPAASTGPHMMNVSGEDDWDEMEVWVNSAPFYDVSFESVGDPVSTSGTLSPTVNINNTGTLADSQDVEVSLLSPGQNPITYASNTQTVSLVGETDTDVNFNFDLSTTGVSEGIQKLKVTTDNKTVTQKVVVIDFDVAFTSVTNQAYAASNDQVTLTAEVSHGVSDLKDQEVSTTVEIAPQNTALTDGSTVSKTLTFENSEQSKTVSLTATPDYSSLGPTSYQVDVDESATGDSASESVTVRKTDLNVEFVKAPDQIDFGDDLEVKLSVVNDGNIEQSGDVRLIRTNNTDYEVGTVGFSNLANGTSTTQNLTYSHDGTDGINDTFSPGDTVGLALRAYDNSNNLLEADTHTTDIATLSNSNYLLSIDDSQTDDTVTEGEDFTVTTDVGLQNIGALNNQVGVNGILTETLEVAVPGIGTKSSTLSLGLGGVSETTTFSTVVGNEGSYTITSSLLGLPLVEDTATIDVQKATPTFEVTSLSAADSVMIGDTLNLGATMENTGSLPGTADISVVFGGVPLLDTTALLNTGQSTSVTTALDTSTLSSTGTYTLEVSTQNDSATSDVTVNGDPASFDVTILSANNPDTGDDLNIDVNIKNTGDVTDTQDVTVNVGASVGSATQSVTLNGGADTTKTFTIGTQDKDAGDHQATVNTSGNGGSAVTTVTINGAFLEIDLPNSPNSITQGDDLNIDYEVTNTGNDQGSSTIELYVDQKTGSVDSDALNNVGGGNSVSGTLTFSKVAANYNPGDTISWTVELSTSSSSVSGTTDVDAGAPASFDVSILGTNNPNAGNDLSVGVEVTNTGDQTGTVDVSMDIPGIGSKTETMQDMTGGELRTHTFTFSTSTDDIGTHTATADTGDNTETTQVTIYGANIQIQSAGGPSIISPGDDLSIDYTLENVGNQDGTESYVDLNIDGSLKTWDSDVTVPAGGTTSGTVTFTSTSGYSDGDTIDWTVELANFGGSTTGNVAVSGSGGGGGGDPASFGVTIQGTNSPVKEGDTLNVDVLINNAGDKQGTQTISLSTGGLGTASTSPVTLAGGGSTTRTLSVSTSNGDAGAYTATVSSEDQSATEGVTVTTGAAPSNFNIQIDSIAGDSFNPVVEVPASGTTVDVDYTVENTGGKAGSTSVTIDRNGNQVGSTSETVPPGQDRSGTFSVSIGDSHISGNGIDIEVASTDDLATETIETKALRINSHDVDNDVHPFLTEYLGNITTKVKNIGSKQASDTLIADVEGSGSQTSKSITVSSESSKTYDMNLEEENFGQYGYVNAKLDTYGDEDDSYTNYAAFDVRGDIWVDQSYIDQLDVDDSSSCNPPFCTSISVDYTLDVPWSGYVEDGFNRIDGQAFRLTGDGSVFGDIGLGDSTAVRTESGIGSDIGYSQLVSELLGSDHYYQQFIHFFTDSNNNALEYEFDDITKWYWYDTTYCGISKDMSDFDGGEYGTPSDPGNGIDMGDAHITVQNSQGDNQCNRLTEESGFLDP